MELYILLAIIWLGGVIFCGLWRISAAIMLSQQVMFAIKRGEVLAAIVRDFFWFVHLPWVALKLLFKDV